MEKFDRSFSKRFLLGHRWKFLEDSKKIMTKGNVEVSSDRNLIWEWYNRLILLSVMLAEPMNSYEVTGGNDDVDIKWNKDWIAVSFFGGNENLKRVFLVSVSGFGRFLRGDIDSMKKEAVNCIDEFVGLGPAGFGDENNFVLLVECKLNLLEGWKCSGGLHLFSVMRGVPNLGKEWF